MHSALQKAPQSYPILLAQVDFLLSKGKAEWALQVAQQAVNSAPSEFLTWAKLSEAHIELGQFDKALLTLNSCPMFTYNERDLHRLPAPARTHLPVKKFIAESSLLDEDSARDNEADVALLRLPAPGLRGTFAKAYHLLTILVSKVGWDELLKTRSAVFVMEEEWRQHKTTASMDGPVGSISAPAAAGRREENGHADEDASTRGIHSPDAGSDGGIPSIRVSIDSAADEATLNGGGASDAPAQKETVVTAPTLEKPESLKHAPDESTDKDGQEGFEGSAFSNKRLCERWLGKELVEGCRTNSPDNLFLVLYEDLRVYTIWRAEISHFQTQHMSYSKTGYEVSFSVRDRT